MTKKGILVLAYGAPNKPEDILPFYTDIRRGKEPTAELLKELEDRYALIGGSSPLLKITRMQMDAISKRFNDEVPIFLGMRHWEPWIHEGVKEMQDAGIEEAVVIVMAPHYSKMSVGKYWERLEEALEKYDYHPKLHRIDSWHTNPDYIKALAEKVENAMQEFSRDERDEVLLMLTAHSLPERIKTWNDPYQEQLLETGRLLSEELGHSKWTFAFQSAGRTPEPWLGPDILDAIKDKSNEGEKKLLVCSIGFIADHLEVIYDIDIEAKPEAEKNGVKLVRAESLNDSSLLINTFEKLIREKLKI